MSKLIMNLSDDIVSLKTGNGQVFHVRASRIAWVEEGESGVKVKLHGRFWPLKVTTNSGLNALDGMRKLCGIS
jgi:hypothetical protein